MLLQKIENWHVGGGVHRGFNLKLNSKDEWLKWKPDGEALFSNSGKSIRDAIEAYVVAGVVDGEKLQSHWFGSKRADVFISHSHKDEDLAISIAGWLYKKFELLAFVDSCVWGRSGDLLKKLDIKYSKNPEPQTTYDYDKRNRTTSHVHMMLSTALVDMIDRTECFIFLNTGESIVKNDIETTVRNESTTTSPWIYAELATSRVVRERPTGRVATHVRKFAVESGAMDSIEIEYPAPLSHLRPISRLDLDLWERSGKQKLEALDKLYELYG